jgi:hypothetical protein
MYIITSFGQYIFKPEFAVTAEEIKNGMMGRTFCISLKRRD